MLVRKLKAHPASASTLGSGGDEEKEIITSAEWAWKRWVDLAEPQIL